MSDKPDTPQVPDSLPDEGLTTEDSYDHAAAVAEAREKLTAHLDETIHEGVKGADGETHDLTGTDMCGKAAREMMRQIVRGVIPTRYRAYSEQKYEKGKNPTLNARRASYATLFEQAMLVFMPGAHRDECMLDIVVQHHAPEVYKAIRAKLDKAEADNDLTAARDAMSALFVRFLRIAYTMPGF